MIRYLPAYSVRRVNELKRWRNERSDISVDKAVDKRPTFIYVVRGPKVCRSAFANFMRLNEQKIVRQGKKIATASCFHGYDTRLSESHRGHIGPQRQIVDGLLDNLGSIYGLESSTGRGSTSKVMVLLLPSEMNRYELYQNYVEVYNKLKDDAMGFISCAIPTDPLIISDFSKYWDDGHPALKIAKSGCEFCDLCTKLCHDLRSVRQ